MFLILVDVIETEDVWMLDQLHDGDLALHLADKNRHTFTTARAQNVTPCTILAFYHIMGGPKCGTMVGAWCVQDTTYKAFED